MSSSDNKDNKIIHAVPTSLLLDMREANTVYEEQGVEAYTDYMLNRGDEPFEPGRLFTSLFPLFKNHDDQPSVHEFVIFSRNSPITARPLVMSLMKHFAEYLPEGDDGKPEIPRMMFTSGAPVAPFLDAYGVDWFHTANPQDVIDAAAVGRTALYHGDDGLGAPRSYEETKEFFAQTPKPFEQEAKQDERPEFKGTRLHVILDQDGVLYGSEAEQVYQAGGLESFQEHELEHLQNPLSEGQVTDFFTKASKINEMFSPQRSPIVMHSVTHRGGAAIFRSIETIYQRRAVFNGTVHYVAGDDKTPYIEAIKSTIPHEEPVIFLDDKEKNVRAGVDAGVMSALFFDGGADDFEL